jgi:NAD(P)-dependent dehydrogenase (short-subunit alcohol dehydrogenase family)
MLDSGLAGKTCLITGGSTGIGLGIARALAREGVHLAVASRNPDSQAIAELRKLSGRAIAIRADVSTEEGTVQMVHQAVEQLGHLDLYVNNSAGTWHEPITRITSEKYFRTMNTNLDACVFACREAARHMIPRRSGSILMFMETVAIELAPYGIRVNLLTPGSFPTRMVAGIPPHIEAKLKTQIPLRRSGDPDECGPASVLLLSDRLSGYTTGSDIVIDGGLSLRPLSLWTDEEILKMNSSED